MAEKTFVADVDKIIRASEERMNALIRQSTQEVIDIAQTPGFSVASTKIAIKKGLGGRGKKKIQGPVPSGGKGGKMRVDTGFLRASGRISFSGMPSGPTRGEPGKTYAYDEGSVELKLAGAKVGMTIFFGWTAAYALIRETYDGFMISAVQKWPSIVEKITNQIREQIK